ncbi:PAS domain S-box protein [Planktothrix sp. FACHB-1365]|uniref:PAS domain S-box protein n=1 Tax=Planktothrix sp. FACHB-1365 TaxID=2692855 RepID=UPI0016824A92|nr:PAS domain S-box protein [Planktothrix sp. FACHB-1365]MBD2485239.1 PAS domain S-box protein [Planktothrix sp. FACHB-1365]
MDFSQFFRSLWISQTWKKIPLRFVLIIPFVIQITATVSIIGYLSFLSGQRAIEKMSNELMIEVTQRVKDHIEHLTEDTETITHLTLSHCQAENIDLNNLNLLERQLFLNLHHFKFISAILVGNEQHQFVAVSRFNGQRLWRSSPQDSSLIYDYALDQTGKPIKLLRTFWKPSVTLRPWYQDAVKSQKTRWGSLYLLGSQEDWVLNLNTPIYEPETGKLLGVLSVGIVSSDLSDFLSQIQVGDAGQIILIDRQGNVVANSQGKVNQQKHQELKQINILNSQDLLLNSIGKFLIKNYGDLQNLQTVQNVDFTIPLTTWESLSNHYYLQVVPLKNQYGLDLLTIIVIPRSDFMAEVYAQFKQTFFLCTGIVILAIGVGILTSRWIIKPILAVNQAAKRIAEGEIQHLSDFERSDEIGELVQSFKGMNTQLQNTLVQLKIEILKHKKTEAKLRQAQHISRLSIWEFYYQTKTTIWSPEIYQLYGLDPIVKPPQGEEILQYIYPDDHSIYRHEILKPLWAKKPFAAELRIVRCDGSIGYVEIQGEPIFDQQHKEVIRLLGTLRDVTDRRQVEITLKNQEQLLRSIYEGVEEPIFVVEVGDNGEFYYVGTNPAHERITGFSRKSLLGKTPQELKIPSWEKVIQHYQDCIDAGTSICYEEVVVLNGVERFWYTSLTPLKDLESKIYRIVGTTIDTTYIKKTERSLQSALQQIQEHFENSPLAIIEWDAQGKIKRWSKQAEDIFGWKADEVVGLSNDDFSMIHEEDQENVYQEIQKMISGQTSTLKMQNRNYTKTGEILTCEWFSSGIFDQHGNLTSTLSFIQDITARQQAEEILRQSEERFRSAFTNTAIGMFIVSTNCRFLQVNDAICQILGYSEAELLNLTFHDITYPDDLERDLSYVKQILEGKIKTYTLEKRLIHKKGNLVSGLLSIGFVQDRQNHPLYFVAQFQDITQRVQAEQALKESEQRFERAIKGSNDGIWDWFDIHQEQIWYSPRFFEIMGYQPNEFQPTLTRFRNFIHPDDRQSVFQTIENHLQFNSPYFIEYRLLHKLGDYIWVQARGEALRDEQGNPVSMAGSVTDITEQKLGELALRQSEAKWRHLIEANIVGILFADFEGRILEANDAFLRIIGYSREELEKGQLRWDTITPPEGKAADQERVQKILNDKILPPDEKEYFHKDGTRIPVILGATLLEEQNQCVAFVLDITQQKQTKIELQKAKEQAEAANRAKSNFLANMSHELRTPLNAILGFTQLMVRDSTLASHHREKLQIINRNGAYLLQLINDILSISKIEANHVTLDITLFDLYQLLEDLKNTFELRSSSKGIQLIIEKSPQLPRYIQTDERKLRQVLINLLDNAIKFTYRGSVTLRIKPLDLTVNGSDSSRYTLEFEVQDTGDGIASEELDSMFDAFVQTTTGRQSQQGTGLGLPISRRFVELLGGKITVRSQVGIGTCFQFTIEVPEIDTTTLALSQPEYQVMGLAPHQPEYRILVVDDLEANRHWLAKLLRSVGFEVEEAENGEMALILVESYNPHLIWMDLRMSGMNGYRATQEIRAKKAQTLLSTPPDFEPFPKIIAVSASVFEEERQQVIDAGCDDFVGKPLTETTIWEMLKKHLGVKYRVEELKPNQAEHHQIQDAVIVEALATLPPELLHQLATETQIGDSEKLLSLLTQIPASQPFLINTLTELINNFEFELILHWVTLALS